jgi:hypothetical protein
MVCSQACKAAQSVPGGIGHCSICGAGCNIANKMCTQCATKASVCEVCGKSMTGSASRPATQPAAGEMTITETDAGKTLAVAAGVSIVVRLPSEGPGPKPPLRWTAARDGNSIEQVGEIRLRARTRPAGGGLVAVQQGGPMDMEAVFRAVRPGKTTLKLECRPSGQGGGTPTKTFTVTLDVQVGQTASAPAKRPSEDEVKRIALAAVTERWPDWRKEHNVTDDTKVFRDIIRPGLAKAWHVTVLAGPSGGKPPLIVLVRVDAETGAVLEVSKGGGGLP